MSLKEDIKEILTFTKGERKGIIVLLIILFIVILAKIFSGYFLNNKEYDYSEFDKEIAEFEKQISKSDFASSSIKPKSSSLFLFNPNTASEDEFINLGLNNRQINTIKNYLSAGGKFNCRSDLKKIYTLSEEQYLILEPYIDLPVKKINFDTIYKGVKSNKTLFYFDPNKASDNDWINLGFSEKQVSVIRNYINNGGKFYKKDDLKKVYVISNERYNELKPYIQIDNSLLNSENTESSFDQRIDINSYTEEDFVKLGGIWEKLAGRLVKFRNLLGGYIAKEQLLEVYGFKKEYYNPFFESIDVNLSVIKKININFADAYELSRHPYLSKEQAEKIVNYRNLNGSYKFLDQLIKKDILSDKSYRKIKPYLKIR